MDPEAPIHWILLRGLVREARHWGPFTGRLQEAFPRDTVVTPDLPGCGLRKSEKSPLSIDGYAAAIEDEIAALPGPRVMVALSLGGMVALSLRQRRPELLQGLVLINSSAAWLSPCFRRVRPAAWPNLLASLWRLNPASREAGILRLVSNSPEARTEALPLWTRIQKDRPLNRLSALRQLTAAASFRLPAECPELPSPVLVLSSQQDRLVHPSCSTLLARHLKAPQIIHPGAGHDLPLDAPAWLLHQLGDFRRRIVSRSSEPHLISSKT